MKHLISFFFSLLIPLISIAQQPKIDSLMIEFKKEKIDSSKARILSDIGLIAYSMNMELAKKYNDSLISFSKGKSEKYLAQGYRMRGTFFLLDGDYDSSLQEYNKSLKIFKKIGYYKGHVAALGNLGTLYGRKGDDEKSKEYHLKVIDLNKKNNREDQSINSYYNLSIIASTNSQLEQAVKYLVKALKIAEENNSNLKMYIHNQLAGNYLKLYRYDTAEEHLIKALSYAEKEQNSFALGRIHNSYGFLYESRNFNHHKSLEHYKKSLFYLTKMNNKIGMIDATNNVGLQYYQLNNIEKAKEYFIQGIEFANEINSEDKKIEGNFYLASLFAKQGKIREANKYIAKADIILKNNSKILIKDHFHRLGKAFEEGGSYKEAYKYMETYAVLADSLFKQNGVDKLAEVEAKYQTEKNKKENLQLKADKVEQQLLTQNANTQKWYFAIGLIASLITLGVFYFYYQKSKKQKNIIENLQKELHHRIKNNLSIIDTFIEVAKEEFNDSKFEIKLNELQNRIDSINEVHQQLYQNHDVTNLNLKKYIDTLAKNINASFSDSNIHLKTNIDDDLNINADKSFSVGLIVNEFLTNSYKYAFDNAYGEIQIGMKEKKQHFELMLSDNGKGLPNNFDIKKIDSFGMRIMKLLTEQLNGTFNLSNNNGVALQITFPKT